VFRRRSPKFPPGIYLRFNGLEEEFANFSWVREVLACQENDPLVRKQWDFEEVASLEFATDLQGFSNRSQGGDPIYEAAVAWLSNRSREQFDRLRERVEVDVLATGVRGEPPSDLKLQLQRLGLTLNRIRP
jgi:hypothetical protein